MRLRQGLLLPMAATAAAVGLAWASWAWLRPVRALDVRRYAALMAAGRVESAAELLRAQLRRDPDDPQASYLLATMILDQPDPAASEELARAQAGQALELLARARPETPQQAALVELYRGKALYILKRWAEVEARMKAALELDPVVPEAGWALLDLYYLQGRSRDASALALRLHQVEPDPRDRVQLLLELVRQDAQPPDAASIVELFHPVVAADPDDVRGAVTLGNALIRNSQGDEGLAVLRRTVERHPDDPLAWQGLLAGYDEAGRLDALVESLDRLPAPLADDLRFARFRGRIAQERGDWPAAAAAYRQAAALDPHDPTLLYRLSRALRFAGETAEGDRLAAQHEAYKAALQEVKELYNEANAIPTFGTRPYPALYRRLADLRERLLWPEQAVAWRRLAGQGTVTPPAL